jgi:hypothetical protein
MDRAGNVAHALPWVGLIEVRTDADLQDPVPADFNGIATVTDDEDSQ